MCLAHDRIHRQQRKDGIWERIEKGGKRNDRNKELKEKDPFLIRAGADGERAS
jgi:hypothetical protein